MSEQSPADSATPEQRLAALFSPPAEASASEEAPQAEESEQTEQIEATDSTEEVEQTAPEDDGEEFDVDGETYRLPPTLKAKVQEWKDGYERRADYTRKTQELAELHRHVSAIAEAADVRSKFEQSIAPEREQLARLKSQLEGFKSLDWNSIDADVAQRLFYQREQLKEQASELEKTIGAKSDQFKQWTEGKRREVIQQGQRYLQQTIKGWGPEAVKEVSNVAQSIGYSAEEIDSVLDPRFVRLAHMAAQWQKLQSGKEAAVSSAKKAPPVVKPGVGQGQRAASEKRYLDVRKSLKKSGSIDDAAKLLLMRGLK